MLNLKNYYKPVCSFLLTLIILSCTQENFKTNTISPDTQVIPLKEAVSTLDKLLGDIYGATKAGPSYNIDEAVVFGGITTKSGEITLPDSSVYIINFNDSNGFALLAAQKNMITPVFCITESGSLSEEDLCNALEKLEQETSSLTKSDDGDEEYFASTGEQFVPTLLAASMINQMSGAPGSGGDGHAWVIDGLFVRSKINDITGNTVSIEKLFHINWGWNSAFDGYFDQGVFDTTKRVAFDDMISRIYFRL